MNAYISGTGVISAQQTWNGEALRNGFVPLKESRQPAVEPDYSAFIDAKQIRRMSRVIRMGIVAASLASRESGIAKPDAILTGTAFGCLEDTYNFLSKQVQYKEEMLSPTAFIHSTHNTIASQIALWFGCRGYNSTYVHRAQSFESAMLDAMMLLEEGTLKTALVGGIDEMTDASYTIMDRMGHFRNDDHSGKGATGSEGAVYFALTSSKTSASYARIALTEQFSFTSPEETAQRISALISENGIQKPGLLFTGHNGDASNDAGYDHIVNKLQCSDRVVKYKQHCGEYATASAFGTWLAAETIRNKPILQSINISENHTADSVLLYNNLEGNHHSLILVLPC